MRQHLKGALPRQRPPGGVVGYVVDLEQFDGTASTSTSTSAGAPSASVEAEPVVQALVEAEPVVQALVEAEPVVQALVEAEPAALPADTAVVARGVVARAVVDTAVTAIVTSDTVRDCFAGLPDDDTVELTIDWSALADATHMTPLPDLSEPATGRVAAHVPGRRLRAAVVIGAAFAVVVAAGVGYGALNQASPPSRGALPPSVQEPVPRADPDDDFTASVVPGVDLVRGSAPKRTPGPSVSVTAPGAVAPGRAAPRNPTEGRTPSAPRAAPTPRWKDIPAGPKPSPRWESPPAQKPSPQPPAQPTAEPAVGLTATYFRSGEAPPAGSGGAAITVRIDNPGPKGVTGWRVTMTVPGGDKLRRADGASVSHDGETVVFTPLDNATVPAGGSVSFTFEVKDVSIGDPWNCTIDGRPCG